MAVEKLSRIAKLNLSMSIERTYTSFMRNCITLFGGMTEDDDIKELGEVKLLGRWSCVGEARGYCIVQASDVSMIQRWLNNWVAMADIKVTPCLDDNEQRKLLLGKDPSYIVNYNKVKSEAKSGENLYFIKYQFKEGSKNQGFEAFSNMSQEQDEADSGKCESYGRWHVPSLGCGYAVASSPSVFDIYKWAFNWAEMCDCHIVPVLTDNQCRQVIRSKSESDIIFSR